MRLKFVLVILLAGAASISAIIFLHQRSSAPAPGPAPTPAASVAPPPQPTSVPAAAPTPPVIVKRELTPEEREADINAETDRLSEWAMNSDSQSLSNILNDLNSPEKEIRMAAIEAAKQFESTNAIPALKAAAANAVDSQEAIAMLQAADWLALPNANFQGSADAPQLTTAQQQAMDQNRAEAQARRQAYLDRQAGNQNTQSPPGQSAGPAPGSTAPGTAGN